MKGVVQSRHTRAPQNKTVQLVLVTVDTFFKGTSLTIDTTYTAANKYSLLVIVYFKLRKTPLVVGSTRSHKLIQSHSTLVKSDNLSEMSPTVGTTRRHTPSGQ